MTDHLAQVAPPLRKAIEYVECPHCYVSVMYREDGRCLACGKNHLDTAGVDPDKTIVTVENVSKIPACCFMCGTDTQRMQTFSWNYKVNPFTLPPWMIPFVILFSYLPGSQYSTTETLRMPVCKGCAKSARKVKPLSVWTGLDCRLVVHREFRARFEALNGEEVLEWEADSRISSAPKNERVVLSGIGVRL